MNEFIYQFYDGEEWLSVENERYATAEEAKQAGIDAGFEYVRVVPAKNI